jgi:hypothetical protein
MVKMMAVRGSFSKGRNPESNSESPGSGLAECGLLHPPSQTFLFCESGWRLADSYGLKQRCNALEDAVHAQVGVDGRVDGVMV